MRPGGPYWRNRDHGAWMIPKGGVDEGEEPLAAALREFEEELGTRPAGAPRPLTTIRQAGGKWVEAFALEGEFDTSAMNSNLFEMEWPPRSGQMERFPEAEEAALASNRRGRAQDPPEPAPAAGRAGGRAARPGRGLIQRRIRRLVRRVGDVAFIA